MSASRTFKNAAWGHLAEVGKALASPARLEILELLAQAPRTVEVLAGEIDQSVANTSHHLQALRRAQLVTRARDGLHAVYALAGPEVAVLLGSLHAVGVARVAALEKLTRRFFDDRDGLEPLDRDTLLARLACDEVVLIDVRPAREFAAAHVPGARSFPLDELEARLPDLPRDRTVVAYCRGPFCVFSADAVTRLRALGFDARRAELSPTDFTEASA